MPKDYVPQYGMAGDGCGQFVDRKFDDDFACGVSVRNIFRRQNKARQNDCGKIVDSKLDFDFGCGVCDGHFPTPRFRLQYGMTGNVCGEVVNRKLDDDFDPCLCKEHFRRQNRA